VCELVRREAELAKVRLLELDSLEEKIVDHHIADKMDVTFGLSLTAQFSTPLGSVTKSQSVMASVTTRLISSGIRMSPLRSRLYMSHWNQ
jgi:hypothetical protein